MSLYDLVNPRCSFADLVLPSAVTAEIEEIMEDFLFREALLENGLSVRNKILIHGPPGTGKTSIAHAFAWRLKVKLFTASMATVVDSHVGGSEKNIEAVMTFAAQNNVVMLLDEFDSIAMKRSSGETGADKAGNRAVNTLLVSLEGRQPLGMLIACTNLFDSLDPAVIRRFDSVIEVPQPNRKQLKTIAEKIIDGRFKLDVEEILNNATTASDITRYTNMRLRQCVIAEEKARKGGVQLPLDGSPVK